MVKQENDFENDLHFFFHITCGQTSIAYLHVYTDINEYSIQASGKAKIGL